MKPFLKWVGGKRQLLMQIRERMPETFCRYFEPFAGGAAVYFFMSPIGTDGAHLNDSNWRLMATYMAIQGDVETVIGLLKQRRDTADEFYRARQELNAIKREEAEAQLRPDLAALMIFINKTCFNGLYRENSKGLVNTPYGRNEQKGRRVTICDEDALVSASRSLRGMTLTSWDFRAALRIPREGDFVYIDPPYVPVNGTSFQAYTGAGFGPSDHVDLAQCCRDLDLRGVKFLASNADLPAVHDLYQGFRIGTLKARRSVNSNGAGRGQVGEVLISNF